QFIALEFHLPPGYIKRSNDLQVWRGRCVREDCFVKLFFHLVVIRVFDQNHRALSQTGHGFVSGIGLVHAKANLLRICKQLGVEESSLTWVSAKLLLLFLICLLVVWILELLLKNRGRSHGGSPAVEGAPPRESEPSFIPQEDQVGLDRQALLHDP